MKLFTGLRKLRDFQRLQLPFFQSIFDFDIVIEIGYGEEVGRPITLKQLFLLNISSRSTVRRKLNNLVDQGIIIRRKNADDQRASVLTVSPATIKLLTKYGGAMSSISASHFK
jgi:DNA-binding MarR family transcriptional regulator